MKGLKEGLTGKVAVITGTASPKGIGAAIARRFASEGASLFLADTAPEERIQSLAGEIRALAADNARIECGRFDLGEPGQPEAMIEQALATFDRVDVLVNNAGLRDHVAFGEVPRELFDRLVAVNIGAAFFASQAVLPAMRKQGGGRIIHIASQMGSITAEKRSVYSLTKAAIIHLTRSMALELGRDNIIVNAISPGPIKTQPILDRIEQDPDYTDVRSAYLPAQRFGEPEEIAEVAYFLAATDASYMQGSDLLIDGGYTTH